MEIRHIEVCSNRGLHWTIEDQRPICQDPTHAHRFVETHLHRDAVVMPDHTLVTAVSWDTGNPRYQRRVRPDFGLYLDSRWKPPWPHEHVAWPDFGVPTSQSALIHALNRLHSQAKGRRHVEIGCLGGHGRTGTALACLSVLCGLSADSAVDWVREAYCPSAVETDDQHAFVAGLTSRP